MSRWTLALAAALLAAVPIFATPGPDGEAPRKERPRETRTGYIRRMYSKDRAEFGDACRIIASLVTGEHTEEPYEEVKKKLVEREIVGADWDLKQDSKVTKGVIAYMLCKALAVKGGATMRVFGVSQRYALRECNYNGLIPRGSPAEYVTGRELIDILARAEIWQRDGNLDSLRK